MNLTVCDYHVRYAFLSESSLYICLNVKKLLARNRRDIWSLSDINGIRTHNHLVCKPTLKHLADWAVLWLLICTVHLTVCCYHVMHAFQKKSSIYNCLNIKEILAPNMRNIWSLSDCNRTRTQNDLVSKRTLNHLEKLGEWLSCVVSTYLHGAFDHMLLSCH